VPRSTLFRLLVTLESLGFVQRSADGRRYRLGVAVLRLGFEYLASLGLVEHGRPLVDRLRDQTGYSASLVVLDGRDVVYLHRAAPHSPFATAVAIGTRLPAHATVLGHVLLGNLSLAELKLRYPEGRLDARSARTPRDSGALFNAVQQVRAAGWVAAEGFFEPHICTIAAPVLDGAGLVVAAVGVTVPGPQIPEPKRDELVRAVRAAAAALSDRLGHTEARSLEPA
jgi:DNA-binding IclR family transcriptional regulator